MFHYGRTPLHLPLFNKSCFCALSCAVTSYLDIFVFRQDADTKDVALLLAWV